MRACRLANDSAMLFTDVPKKTDLGAKIFP